MFRTVRTSASLAFLLSASSLLAQSPTLAATPPMGWNSWNHFNTHVTDADVRAAADALVASGMRDAGYIYVNIDDSWEAAHRDHHGNIVANSKFPDMKGLSDYVHSKGLKLGIYSSPGPRTCGGYLGSYKHEKQDAATYAKWGIDYLKYDMCSYGNIMDKKFGKPSPANAEARLAADQAVYRRMHNALLATGRPVVFSLCQYGWDDVWRWGDTVGGNLWRTTGDIEDNYHRMAEIGFNQAGLAQYAGPGHWNDPDMLEVGNGGMSPDEYRTHMALWALLAAPLIAGNDLSRMSPETLALLTNKDVIAIDQDVLGRQGDRVWQQGTQEIWTKPLSGGRTAVGLFNRSTQPVPVPLNLAALHLPASAHLHDVFGKTDVQADNGTYSATVPGHGVALLLVTP